MFCTKCGANNKDGSKFCVTCGEALVIAPPAPNATSAVGKGKGKSKVWIPIVAIIAVLVVGVGALWLFTDILPWTDKGGEALGVSAQSPGGDMNDDNATDAAGVEEDADNKEEADSPGSEIGSASTLPQPDISPSQGSSLPSPSTSASPGTSLPSPSVEPADKKSATTGNHTYSVDYLIAGTPEYILYVDEDGMYRMGWDGRNKQVMFDNPTTSYFLDIIDDELYFVVSNYTYFEAPFFVIADLYPVSV